MRQTYDSQRNNDLLWESLAKDLKSSLRKMNHHDVVIIGPRSDRNRYVQFVRDGAVLVGECPGATVEGGPTQLSPTAQLLILDLGWGSPDRGPSDFPNF